MLTYASPGPTSAHHGHIQGQGPWAWSPCPAILPPTHVLLLPGQAPSSLLPRALLSVSRTWCGVRSGPDFEGPQLCSPG